MKNLAIFLILGFALSCSDNIPDAGHLNGSWEWIKSTGGLLPERTPANSGYTETIKLNEGAYQVFRDGILLDSIRYRISKNREKSIDADFILIDPGNSIHNLQVKFESPDYDQISITNYVGPNSICADCETSYYIKTND